MVNKEIVVTACSRMLVGTTTSAGGYDAVSGEFQDRTIDVGLEIGIIRRRILFLPKAPRFRIDDQKTLIGRPRTII